ncbi:hypothetical protein O181_046460 [Austropuccinia psidii MF-1]|uniref:Uncharacterized protein n=1 Tax=Austropuccinia psidii MF-1 TaxID=1389203 RepID=A0A9Q3DNJ3_9BASI|nr:hypothetical protein [Austropuccinia psidii MF-1]
MMRSLPQHQHSEEIHPNTIVVRKAVDVSYGGENGFNQPIHLAADSLSQGKFIQEKGLIQSYLDKIALPTEIVHTAAPPPTASNNTASSQSAGGTARNISLALCHLLEKEQE